MSIAITTGNTIADDAHNRLVKASKAAVPRAGTGTRVTRTQFGMVFNGANRPVVRPSVQLLYQITELLGKNYFKAQLLDETGAKNGTDEYIAKSFTGQVPESMSEVIDTRTINYSDVDDNNRTAQNDLIGTETQVCHPRYRVGDVVLVVKLPGGIINMDGNGNAIPMQDDDHNPITLYEFSPERVWAAAPDDFTPPAS